jgi:hypothetical protein
MAKSQAEKYDAKSATKEYLDAAPKVTIMLELRDGEYPVERVCINDNVYWVERGKKVEVPEPVADVLYAKMRAEGKLAQMSKEYETTGHTDPQGSDSTGDNVQ